MKQNLSIAAALLLCVSSVARADVNAAAEGAYDVACQQITLTAGIAKTSCQEEPDGVACNAESIGEPVEIRIPCNRSELMTGVDELRAQCETLQLWVVYADGHKTNFGPDACDKAIDVVEAGANAWADFTSGEFIIDVESYTWISKMDGTFVNEFDNRLALKYATLSYPWSKNFSFAVTGAFPLPVKLINVCDGQATIAGTSGGSVVKATGVLALNYDLKTTITCNRENGSSAKYTLDVRGDFAGTKKASAPNPPADTVQ